MLQPIVAINPVLDEPSIGLHPRDIGRLIGVMEGLRDKGNTLLVVEHEESACVPPITSSKSAPAAVIKAASSSIPAISMACFSKKAR